MFGIVDDTSFEKQLEDLTVKSERQPRAIVQSITRGRGEIKEIPLELKKVIAGEAINGIPAKQLSELFKVSPSSISAYKNDATSTASYNQPNEELAKHNNAVKEEIIVGARSRLLAAIENITDEKLSEAKVRDVAGIAKDMSAVIRNMEPETNRNPGGLNQQFIFYAPKTRQESDFEVIEARE